MKKEVKNKLVRIVVASLFLICAVIVDKCFCMNMWIRLLIYLPAYLIVGAEVLKEATENLIHGELFDEDFLMSIATLGAMAIGFLPEGHPEFIEAVFVMIFFQVGEMFEEIAEGKSEKAIKDLMNIRPDYANIESDGKMVKVNPEDVEIGDVIVIQPGEKVPMDGIIIDGQTSLNTIALTGESIPRSANVGDDIKSGCINLNGKVKVKVTASFKESTASQIIKLVEDAGEKKSKSEGFITKFSRIYTPIVVISAVLLAIIPPIIAGDFNTSFATWLQRALTFLVVSCPCALVISVPLSFFGGIGGASKRGILIKGSNYIDILSNIKTIVFDKTGTLTNGTFEVSAIHPELYDEEKLLHLVAHVERHSKHPIAISLKNAYKNEADDCIITEVEEIPGKGMKARVNDDIVYVGNEKLMESLNITWKECEKEGTIIHAAINGDYFGHIVISDVIKEEAKTEIEKITPSVEANKDILQNIISNSSIPVEPIVYGRTVLMNTSYCFLGKSNRCYPECNILCQNDKKYYLKDRLGLRFRIMPDNLQTVTSLYNSKITSFDTKDLNVDSVRINILDESIDEINKIISEVKLGNRLEGQDYTNGNLNRKI